MRLGCLPGCNFCCYKQEVVWVGLCDIEWREKEMPFCRNKSCSNFGSYCNFCRSDWHYLQQNKCWKCCDNTTFTSNQFILSHLFLKSTSFFLSLPMVHSIYITMRSLTFENNGQLGSSFFFPLFSIMQHQYYLRLDNRLSTTHDKLTVGK